MPKTGSRAIRPKCTATASAANAGRYGRRSRAAEKRFPSTAWPTGGRSIRLSGSQFLRMACSVTFQNCMTCPPFPME